MKKKSLKVPVSRFHDQMTSLAIIAVGLVLVLVIGLHQSPTELALALSRNSYATYILWGVILLAGGCIVYGWIKLLTTQRRFARFESERAARIRTERCVWDSNRAK